MGKKIAIIGGVAGNLVQLAGNAFAQEYADMGGMALNDYSYLMGLLGVVCALAFILGINQQ